MHFSIVTLFPGFFRSLDTGLLGKAVRAGLVTHRIVNPRDTCTDRHQQVDDAPYGGGQGMLLMPGPMVSAMDRADEQNGGVRGRRVLLSPQGTPFRQRDAVRLAKESHLTVICGRYEGFDERIRDFVDEEISIGDFVLFGGEAGALVIIEAISRLIPGVLGNPRSAPDESHSASRLEYPQYTRPAEFRGKRVPDVLLSGDHGEIERWRRRASIRRTLERRPDLLRCADLDEEEREWLSEMQMDQSRKGE